MRAASRIAIDERRARALDVRAAMSEAKGFAGYMRQLKPPADE